MHDVTSHTELTLTNLHKSTELCLSKCYFLHENNLRLFQKSGSFRLSLTEVLSKFFSQKLESKAIMKALNYRTAAKTFRHFVDDIYARLQER